MLKLGELNTVLRANLAPFERDLAKAKKSFKDHADGMKTAALGAATAITAGLGAGILMGIEQSKPGAVLAAQLGAGTPLAAAAGEAAGALYARGVVGTMEEATAAIKATVQNALTPPGSSTAMIEKVAAKVANLSVIMEEDADKVSAAVSNMLRNGLAKNAEEAFDILQRGVETGVNKSQDLLDTFNEYGPQFKKLGLDGPAAMGLLSQAVKAGARDADTAADALKEFAIRAADGSTTSAAGFKALGMDAEKMTKIFAKGGKGAAAGLDTVLDKLVDMDDPVKQEAAAVALFGTKAEDLQKSLLAMDPSSAAEGLGRLAGASDKAGKSLEESSGAKLERFKRTMQAALIDKMAEAIPFIEATFGFLSEHSEVIGPLAVGLGILAGVIYAVSAAMKVWAVIQTIMNLALWTSPITWIVIGIIALVAVIVLIAKKTTWFQTAWKVAWGGIKKAASAVGLWFSNTLWKKWILGAWNGIINAGKRAWAWMKTLPGSIKKAFSRVGDFITAPFRGAFNAIAGFWNRTVGGMSFTMPGWIPGMGGKGFSMPRMPHLNTGGRILESGLAVVHRGERVVQAARATTATTGGQPTEQRIRLRLEWPNGDKIREVIIDGASARGQSPGQYLKVA